jgi:hypothetical protein
MLTKREGILFAACVLLAALVASFVDRRRLWKPLLAAGLLAFALALPWRIWFTAHGLPGDGPQLGYLGSFSHLDRVWPALRLNVATLLDDDLWHYAPFLAAAAIVLGALARVWKESLFAAAFVVARIAAGTWVSWSNPVASNDVWPVHRYAAITLLALAALTPLLLQRAWSAVSPVTAGTADRDVLFGSSRLAWLVVLVGVLSHPASMLVGYSGSGLPGTEPSFPGATGCAAAPAGGSNVRVVVGYAESYPEATAMRERARAAGLGGVRAGQDGCGQVRVYVDGSSEVEASELVARAQAAGLEPTIEADSGP